MSVVVLSRRFVSGFESCVIWKRSGENALIGLWRDQHGKATELVGWLLGRAHWTIAMRLLANNSLAGAAKHFRRSVDKRQFYLAHYWWSRAFLEQVEGTNDWPRAADE